MKFLDDAPVFCRECNEFIVAGESYSVFKHSGKLYKCCTSTDCKSHLLYKIFEDDFEDVELLTAEDKEDIYADMQGD